MSLQSYIQPWAGNAVRHIPKIAVGQYDIYDFSYAGRSAENRWNRQGEPTLYLAKVRSKTAENSGKLVKKQKAVMLRLNKMGIININSRQA